MLLMFCFIHIYLLLLLYNSTRLKVHLNLCHEIESMQEEKSLVSGPGYKYLKGSFANWKILYDNG